jgi:hypothetical protein
MQEMYMKKSVFRIMVIVFVLGMLTSCPDLFKSGSGNNSANGPAWKIGIASLSESNGKEEYWMAKRLQTEFEAGKILHAIMPSNSLSDPTDTDGVIQAIESLASDSKVEAIVVIHAVPGTSEAINRIRQTRPDLLFIAGIPYEQPGTIASKADLVLETNNLARGAQIANQAKDMGATTLVHYSFPRHMSYDHLAARRDLMKTTAEILGLVFVSVENVPDPMSDGIQATQAFITGDVPSKVSDYGEDTAFFGTNCGMMVPLIQAVLDTGAIFPVQCCPSPLHALPEALDIEISSEQMADISWVLEQIQSKVTAADAGGRIATWPMPVNMMFLAAGVHYADALLAGTIDTVDDFLNLAALESIMVELSGSNVTLSNLDEYDNYLLFLSDPIVF